MSHPTTSLLRLFLLLAATPLLPGCLGVDGQGEEVWQDDAEDRDRVAQFTHPPPPGPAPWGYTLTSYGGPNDYSAYGGMPACGGKRVNGSWYYATGAWSFGCFSRLRLTANGKCVVVEVVDNGPALWVENKAKLSCGGSGYIIDASPLVSSYLHGTASAGWSDCLPIQVQPVASNTPAGPCSAGAPPSPPSTDAPGTPSCTASRCGSSAPVPGSSPPCYCDSLCVSKGDCCPGFKAACPGT